MPGVFFELTYILCASVNPNSPTAPDAATKVAGVYDLTYSIAYQKAYTDLPGSLTFGTVRCSTR